MISAISEPAFPKAVMAIASAIDRLRITVPYTSAMASPRLKKNFPTSVLSPKFSAYKTSSGRNSFSRCAGFCAMESDFSAMATKTMPTTPRVEKGGKSGFRSF